MRRIKFSILLLVCVCVVAGSATGCSTGVRILSFLKNEDSAEVTMTEARTVLENDTKGWVNIARFISPFEVATITGNTNFSVLLVLQPIDTLYVTLDDVLVFELILNLYMSPYTLTTVTDDCPLYTVGFSEASKQTYLVDVSVKYPELLVIDVEVIVPVDLSNMFSYTQMSYNVSLLDGL